MEPCWRVAHFLFCILYDNFACLMFYFSNSLFPPWSFLDLDPNANCQPGWPSSCLIFCFLKDKQVSYVTYLKKNVKLRPIPFCTLTMSHCAFHGKKKKKGKKPSWAALSHASATLINSISAFHVLAVLLGILTT